MFRTVSRALGFSGAFSPIDNQTARIAVVDVGSNSVRMVVFDGATRSPAIYFNEKVLCGLGAELGRTGRLSPSGKDRALHALRRFKALADGVEHLEALVVVGTAALRDADDGPDFVAALESEIGTEVRVATGPDEARLAAQGVLIGEPNADGVVADIGGASMELIELSDGVVGDGVTTPLGPLRLESGYDLETRIDAVLEDVMVSAEGPPRFRPDRPLFIVGGSWRALVKAHMAAQKYPLRVLHGFSLSRMEAQEMAEWGARLTVQKLRSLTGASTRRAAVTPNAARVLSRLIRVLAPSRVTLSAFGLREGVLWEHLPEDLRAEDPLLQSCAMLEARHARRPGFGAELWSWLAPAFPTFGAARTRLSAAACLLSDASWRTHPDYRARTNFELVTRNNFGGVSHRDRVFIGIALLYRYKDGGRAVEREPAIRLCPPEEREAAKALGRGMRLGGMLGAASAGVLPLAPLARTDDGLVLRLKGRAKNLDGEELRKRLSGFADALKLERADVELD